MPLLEVEDLRAYFHTRHGVVRAVDGVSFHLEAGETLGIAGESGCGKSVSQYAMLGLMPTPPGRIESGTAHFEGIDLLQCDARTMRTIRGKRISMVFQDPMTALNPYMRVGTQIMEPLLLHERCTRAEAQSRATTLLETLGIQDAEARMAMYPHEFSGGMRQRVLIAMALITKPQMLIADEPTTALDVTVQAQILAHLRNLQQAMNLSVILITHDLGVLSGMCRRILIMYAGRIVESGDTQTVLQAPRHPYTRALLAALPAAHRPGEPLASILGQPPDCIAPFAGCAFAPRCSAARPTCHTTACRLETIAPGHATACLRAQAGEWPGSEEGVRHAASA